MLLRLRKRTGLEHEDVLGKSEPSSKGMARLNPTSLAWQAWLSRQCPALLEALPVDSMDWACVNTL